MIAAGGAFMCSRVQRSSDKPLRSGNCQSRISRSNVSRRSWRNKSSPRSKLCSDHGCSPGSAICCRVCSTRRSSAGSSSSIATRICGDSLSLEQLVVDNSGLINTVKVSGPWLVNVRYDSSVSVLRSERYEIIHPTLLFIP
ncbi:hypothetical protein D3C72_1690090 [compost metagenome]